MKQPEKHMQKPWRPGLICITNGCDKGTVLLSQIEYIQIHTALAGRQENNLQVFTIL